MMAEFAFDGAEDECHTPATPVPATLASSADADPLLACLRTTLVRDAFNVLASSDRLCLALAEWWHRHEAWRAAFPPISLDELEQPKAPPTLGRLHISNPTAAQVAACKEAKEAQAEAHTAWQAKNDERKKALKKAIRNWPADDGARATENRLKQPELLKRHREREADRREAAQPEITEEQVAKAMSDLPSNEQLESRLNSYARQQLPTRLVHVAEQLEAMSAVSPATMESLAALSAPEMATKISEIEQCALQQSRDEERNELRVRAIQQNLSVQTACFPAAVPSGAEVRQAPDGLVMPEANALHAPQLHYSEISDEAMAERTSELPRLGTSVLTMRRGAQGAQWS
jgi:hypothetical protein